MLRMEIALILVNAFIAYMYFSAGRKSSLLHKIFSIVSGYDDFSYCREALRLQITDYILKPVNYEEFGSCIDNLKIALFQRQTSKSEE